MAKKKRIEWIDCVRGMAMVLIIIGHTYVTGFWHFFIFAINVPVFFVLSGYLTHSKGLRRTMKSGIHTLIIPYILTVLVMIILAIIGSKFPNPLLNNGGVHHFVVAGLYGIGTDMNNTIFMGKTVPAIGAIWFLLAMYFGNLIYQVLLKSVDRKSRLVSTLVLLIISIILAIVGFELSKVIILPWSINAALISIIFYVTGHLIKFYHLMDINKQTVLLSIVGLILWIVSAILGPFWFNIGFAAHPIIDVAGAIGGSYFIMLAFKIISTKLNLTLLANFGRLSLIALSVHIVHLNLFNDVQILTTRLTNYGLSPLYIGVLMDLYRIILCIIVVTIISKSKYVRKVFAIR